MMFIGEQLEQTQHIRGNKLSWTWVMFKSEHE